MDADPGRCGFPKMFVSILKSYTAKYADGIRFDAGEPVQVERNDPEFPGWYWCRTSSGQEGWVHQSFLAATEGETVSLQPFSGNEVTVTVGERAFQVCSLDGWSWVKLDDSRQGWIPSAHAG